MKRTTADRRRNAESGQVLILAVVAMILIVIAALLLFDIQTVIRGKVKAQNGVDSAALTAAEWQKQSLNVIGELNLYRATGALLSEPYFGLGVLNNPNSNDGELYTGVDSIPNVNLKEYALLPNAEEYFDGNGDFLWERYDEFTDELIRIEKERRYLLAINELISQMQIRLAFAGPMIAFGAAQQAARNNGLTYNRNANERFDFYRSVVAGDNPLGQLRMQMEDRFVHGYAWRAPYLSMLDSAIGFDYSSNRDDDMRNGYLSNVCVGTNFKFAGMPELVSESSYLAKLGQSRTYQDILHKNWANLRELLEYDYPDNWWNTLQREVKQDYTYQSEILPLHIRIENSRDPYDTAAELKAFGKYDRWKQGLIGDYFNDVDPVEYNADVEITETEETGGRFHKTTQITVGPLTDGEGNPYFLYNDDDADLRYNLLPEFSWALFDSEWQTLSDKRREDWESKMLRGRFKQGMDYQSGARAHFFAEQTTVTLTGSMGQPKRNRNDANVGDVFTQTVAHYDAQQVSDTLKSLESSGFLPKIQTDALATPIGVLKLEDGSRLRPFEAGRMVLPVFDDTALVPVSFDPDDSAGSLSGGGSMSSAWLYYLLDFVPELGDSPTITEAMERAVEKNPERWGYYAPYYFALLMLNNPEFRQEGLDWLDKHKEEYGPGNGGGHATPIYHGDDSGNEFKLH